MSDKLLNLFMIFRNYQSPKIDKTYSLRPIETWFEIFRKNKKSWHSIEVVTTEKVSNNTLYPSTYTSYRLYQVWVKVSYATCVSKCLNKTHLTLYWSYLEVDSLLLTEIFLSQLSMWILCCFFFFFKWL